MLLSAVALGRDANGGKEQPGNFVPRRATRSPGAPPSHRRVAGNTCAASAGAILPLYVSENVGPRSTRRSPARRNVQRVCAHYKFIIQRASHTQTESRSHVLKQEKPPQNPTVALPSAAACFLIFFTSRPSHLPLRKKKTQSKWRLGAHGPRRSLLSRPRFIAFLSDATGFAVRVCRAAGGICENKTCCICVGLRDVFAHSFAPACLFKVAVKRLIL